MVVKLWWCVKKSQQSRQLKNHEFRALNISMLINTICNRDMQQGHL